MQKMIWPCILCICISRCRCWCITCFSSKSPDVDEDGFGVPPNVAGIADETYFGNEADEDDFSKVVAIASELEHQLNK
ncbi:hypothetical protein EV1_028591 [Malus domestica]